MEFPKLETPQLNVRYNLPTSIQTPRTYVPRVPTMFGYGIQTPEPDIMFDMYDPNQMNSFADVFWRFLENSMDAENIWEGLEAFGGSVADSTEVIKGTWAPLTQAIHKEGMKGLSDGQAWAAFGINSLISIGETLDVLANPIKGAILDGGWEGFKKGSFGRETYDFDTGNLATDLLAEVVVDPINWITLGGASLAKGLGKAGISMSDDVLQEVGEKAMKKSIKEFSLAYSGNVDDAVAQVLKKKFVKSLPKNSRDLIKKTLMHNTNLNIIKSVNAIRNVGEAVDKTLMRASMAYTPTLLRAVGGKGLQYIDNQILRHAERFVPEGGHITTMNVIQGMTDISTEVKSLNQIPEIKVSGLSERLVLRKQAKNDFQAIKDILVANSGDLTKTIRDLKNFARKSGTTLENYTAAIRQLDEAQNIKQVSILRNQLDQIEGVVHKAKEDYLQGILTARHANRSSEILEEVSSDLTGITNLHREKEALTDLKYLGDNLSKELKDAFTKPMVDLGFSVDSFLPTEKMNYLIREVADSVNFGLREISKLMVNSMFKEIDNYGVLFDVLNEVDDSIFKTIDSMSWRPHELAIKNEIEEWVRKGVESVLDEPLDNIYKYLKNNSKLKGGTLELRDYRDQLIKLIAPYRNNKVIGDRVKSLVRQLKEADKGALNLINHPEDEITSGLSKQYRWIFNRTIDISNTLAELDQQKLVKRLDALTEDYLSANTTDVFQRVTKEYLGSVDDVINDKKLMKLFDKIEEIDINIDIKTKDRMNALSGLKTYIGDLPTIENDFMIRLKSEYASVINDAVKYMDQDDLSKREMVIKLNELANDLDYFIKRYDESLSGEVGFSQKRISNSMLNKATKEAADMTGYPAELFAKYYKDELKYPLGEYSGHIKEALRVFDGYVNTELAKIVEGSFVMRNMSERRTGDLIINMMKEFSERIRVEDFNVDEIITIKRDYQRYTLKLSQASSTLSLYNVEGIDEIFDNYYEYTQNVHQLIGSSAFTAEDKYRASAILVRLEDMMITRNLYRKVLGKGNPFRETTKIGILDTLENMRNFDLDMAIEDPSFIKRKFLEFAEQNPRANLNKKRYSLEKLGERHYDSIVEFTNSNYADILEDIKNELPQPNAEITHEMMSHDARYDIMVTKFVSEEYGIDLGKNPIIVDIETTGLSETSGDHILQIAWMLPDGTIKNLNIKPKDGQMPTLDFMVKAIGNNDEASVEEVVKAFNNKFATNAVEERDAIEAFLSDLLRVRDMNPDDIGTTIVGHNLDDFDLGFIQTRSRITEAETHNLFSTKNNKFIDTVDTLHELYNQDDVFYLTDEERKAITNMLDEHLQALERTASSDLHKQYQVKGMVPTGVKSRSIRTTPDTYLLNEIGELHDVIVNSTKDMMYDGQYRNTIDLSTPMIQDLTDFSSKLNAYQTRVYDAMNNIVSFNRSHGNQYITRQRLEDMHTNITQLLNKHNIDIKEGKLVGLQAVAGRTDVDTNRILNFYPDLLNQDVPKTVLDKLKGPIRRLEQLRNNIRDTQLTKELHTTEWVRAADLFEVLKARYVSLTPLSTHVAIDKMKFLGHDVRTGLAQLKYIFDKVKSLDQDFIAGLDSSYLLKTLDNDTRLLGDFKLNIFQKQSLTKYMTINHIDEHSEVIENGINLMKQVESLDELLETMDDTKLHNARVFGKFGLLRDTLNDFQSFIDYVDEKFYRAQASMNPNESGVEEVVKIIKNLKKYHDTVSIRRMDILQKMSPEQMKNYLWNKAKGLVIIDLEGAFDNPVYKQGMFTNLDQYTKAGMKVYQDGDTLIIYLPDTFDTSYSAKSFVLPEVDTIESVTKTSEIKMYERARSRLLEKIPEGSGTNFEIMNKSKYYDLLDRLPKDVREDLISFDKLNANNKFDGLNFNHTVHGRVRYRRQWLDYIYNNPFKDLYFTAQEAAKIADSQTKYMHSLTSHGMNLGSDYMKEFSNEDIFAVIKNNKHLRIGAVVKDNKRGFMFKEFRVHKASDINKLREMNAVILPHHLLKTSMSMINNDKITNGFVKFFDKYIVGVYKLGVLSSSGFLLRNLYDSNYKNMVSEGNSILKTTLKTRQLYQEYTGVISDIIETYGHLNPRTIGRYFEGVHEGDLTKEMFNLIDEFIQDGPSAGLSKVMQDKIGNVFKRLENRSEYKGIIQWQDIRDYILNDGVIDKNYPLEIMEELERLSGEYKYYHKGFAMMEHTKNAQLKLDNIVYYLKHPKEIPSHLKSEFKRLKEYEPTSVLTQKIDKKLFENPWSRRIMTFNTHQEQIFRLSNYLHEVLENGSSTSEAIYSVVENHFDTLHKTYHQQLLEMLFPFSVFRLNNIRFWANAIEDHPAHGKAVFDFLQGQIDPDYTEWDLANRRSLQYHILNGSIILDDETGLNIKLSPSVLDAFQALYAPGELVKGSLVPIIKNPFEVMMMEKEDWMDDEYFEQNKRNKLISMLPMGVHQIRQQSRMEDFEETGSVAPLIMPSMFGKTNLPQPYNPKLYPRYNKYYGTNTFSYYTMYPEVTYAESPSAYYKARYSDMRDHMWSPLLSRRVNKSFADREDIFTASGKNKLALMMYDSKPGDAVHTLRNIWR